jgi:hypothetical protein
MLFRTHFAMAYQMLTPASTAADDDGAALAEFIGRLNAARALPPSNACGRG